MKELRSWIVVLGLFARYFYYRFTSSEKRPTMESLDIYDEVLTVIGRVLGWPKYLHIVGDHHCPLDTPAVYCGNHLKLDDPLFVFRTVYLDSQAKVLPRVMARDDFFVGTPLKTRLFDMDDFFLSIQTYEISRGHITLAQLRPFMNFLMDGSSFSMFPGHTRSCSGVFVEYRDTFQEPGGVSFFIHQTQRRQPDVRVPAIPVVRTYNPVSKRSAMIIGEPVYLESDATRDIQRAFDIRLVVAMSQYFEINVPIVLSAVLYLRCLHALPNPVREEELTDIVARILEKTDHPYIDPEGLEQTALAVRQTITYLQKRKMLVRRGDAVECDVEAILSVPDLTSKYRLLNPVKYLTNQILHLGEVTGLIQDEVLRD